MAGVHDHRHHDAAEPTSQQVVTALWVAATICALVTVAGLLVLWPSGERSGSTDPMALAAEPVEATVRSETVAPCSYDAASECRLYVIELAGGDTTEWEQPGDSTLRAGDDILVTPAELADGTTDYTFFDYQRRTPMIVLAVLFIVAVVALGRWRGVGAIGGLVASLGVLVVFMLPSLLDGNNSVAVALVAASVVAFIAIYLAHGFNVASTVALLSTFSALVLTGVLAYVFMQAGNFTGLTEDSTFFLNTLGVPIDPQGILLAGVVIGSLGVLDDVTVTQVSAVLALRRADPQATPWRLYREALTIGRDHISSTVNTLFLAYAGAALPLLLLFTEANQSITSVATREVVAIEIVRALVGSIGLVASVPIATGLAALAFGGTATAAADSVGPDEHRDWLAG